MARLRARYKNLKRYKKIGEVTMKYGFNVVAEKLWEKGLIPKFVLNIDKTDKNLTLGERLRYALEELGPTFIKLGQILSTRRDLLGDEIVNELSKLQDNIAPFPLEEAKIVFEKEMKMSIDEAFKAFDEKPIASASIGQVYEATLKTGENVVVKIQRPNIQLLIERDMDILFNLAKQLDEHMDKNKPVRFYEMVEEFYYTIKRELDYTNEARNAERFGENFKDNKQILVPEVYWNFTSKKVLTLQRIYGIKIMDSRSLRRKGWDLKGLANIGAEAFMKQVFIHGFFHGDPHPGNIFAIDESTIAFIDFGVVGFLDKSNMRMLTNIFTAGARRDVDRLVNTLIEMDAISPETNMRRLKEDVSILINLYYNLPLKNINLGESFRELLEMAYINKVTLPPQLMLLFKSIITLEGSGKYLHPDFSLSDITKRFIKEIYLHRLHPQQLLTEIRDYSEEIIFGMRYFPKQLRNFFKKIETNNIKLNLDHGGFKPLYEELNRLTNKLSLSLITSALIVGSSYMIRNNSNTNQYSVSMLGLVTFVVASLLGVSVVISNLINNWHNWRRK
ncbi:ABC1 kinase family protein [Alkaliphilus hydrothermalis]|uniref:Ubiquinone biosynthesis protein n=1 Tax=Alkaliphilus hydrothermalis TaxID=1482730 RepID=A0ABS2NLS9_9FIRM|nr:AarF/UbiB family protein [Alkaliphilus hydrothermalis]MBM7613891.1 ubiquinone biosynthesis protein [Alkaliphilus hydrothermalis]